MDIGALDELDGTLLLLLLLLLLADTAVELVVYIVGDAELEEICASVLLLV